MRDDGSWWKNNIKGGYVFFHFGNRQMNEVNPHLHLIVEVWDADNVELLGDELKVEWGEYGGGNANVKEIKDSDHSRSSVAHYCTKGIILQFGGEVNELCEEVWKAVHGKQKSYPIGSWRGNGRLSELRVTKGGKKRGRKPKVVVVDPQPTTQETQPTVDSCVIDTSNVGFTSNPAPQMGHGQQGQMGHNPTIGISITHERSELDIRSTTIDRQTDLTDSTRSSFNAKKPTHPS